MSIAALYPSASNGTGGATLSPLSSAAAAPEPLEGAIVQTEPTVSADPQSLDGGPPGASAGPGDSDDEGGIDVQADAELDATIDAALEAAQAPPVDLRVDERKDFFAEVRQSEPPATSPIDYAYFVRSPSDHTMDMEIVSDGLKAAVRMGLGQSSVRALWSAALDASRNPITTSPQAAQAAFVAEFGDKAEATAASAVAWIEKVAQNWPAVKPWLQTTGLIRDPRFIAFMARDAQRRGL